MRLRTANARNFVACPSSLDDDSIMGFLPSVSGSTAQRCSLQQRRSIPSARHLRYVLLALTSLNLLSSARICADEAPARQVPKPTTFRQGSFILHTDLPPNLAEERLAGLSQLKQRLDQYWNSQLSGDIHCYVVVNLDAWPADSIPQEAIAKLKIRSAITLTDRLKEDDRVISIKSTVYTTDRVENLHHEVVHAYCWQTFQRCGPPWYAEGMAEVFGWSHHGANSVHYFDWAIKYLQENTQPPSVAEITNDAPTKQPQWQTYAQRWALCYLLSQNPRYADRFRKFGQQLLHSEDVDFAKSFADIQEPLAHDYRQFLRHLHPGFTFPILPVTDGTAKD
jgi:hypothetical protein